MRILALPLGLLLIGACGGDSGAKIESCAGRPSTQRVCIETQKADPHATLTTDMDLCRQSGGTWFKGPCDRTDVLGGCTLGLLHTPDGELTQITWYYPGDRLKTADDVMAQCTKISATYVSP